MNERAISAALAVFILLLIPSIVVGDTGLVEVLTAPDAAAGDRFGSAVAVDESVVLGERTVTQIVVAGALNDDDGATDCGSAWVRYPAADGTMIWQKLTVPDPGEGDYLGWSVDVSGDRVVVGGPGRRAIVFRYSEGSFVHEADLVPTGVTISHEYGRGVAISGDTVVVADSYYKKVYVFVRTESGWQESQTLDSGADSAAWFGTDVDIDADRAIIGSAGDGAYVFVRQEGSWLLEQRLTVPETVTGDSFGGRVAISGDTAAVSAMTWEGVAEKSGAVHVFHRGTESWSREKFLVASVEQGGAYFGCSVALSGQVLLVGANRDTAGDILVAGAVYGFTLRAGEWKEFRRITLPDCVHGDEFGLSVAISGKVAIAGAWHDDDAANNAGTMAVFHADPGLRIVTTVLPDAAAGRPYAVDVEAAGGSEDHEYRLSGGSLPAGLALDPVTGRISGTPTEDGRFPLNVVVEDSYEIESEVVPLGLDVNPVGDLATRKLRDEVDLSDRERVTALELVRGTLLTVKVKFPKGVPDAATLRLLDPLGATVDLVEHLKVKSKGITLKKFEIPCCGRWFLVLEPADGASGAARMDVKVKAPKKGKGAFEMEAGATETLVVGALPGAAAKVEVKAGSWSVAVPEIVSVTDEAGNDLLAIGQLSVKGKKVAVKLPDTRAAGRITVVFRNAADLPGVLSVKVAVKQPKAYGYTRPEEPCGLMR